MKNSLMKNFIFCAVVIGCRGLLISSIMYNLTRSLKKPRRISSYPIETDLVQSLNLFCLADIKTEGVALVNRVLRAILRK